MAVPTKIVATLDDFKQIFVPSASTGVVPDALLLCIENPGDGISPEALKSFIANVNHSAEKHKANVMLFIWDCSSPAFVEAKTQVEKVVGSPLLLIVYKGTIADAIRGKSIEEIGGTDVPRVCERLASFQQSKPVATISTGTVGEEHDAKLTVDVTKMMTVGQNLLASGKVCYAEKCFVKAIATLDSVLEEVQLSAQASENADAYMEPYYRSLSSSLSWAAQCQFVQGRSASDNLFLQRIMASADMREYAEEPFSDACRALTTQSLMQGAPSQWTDETGSMQTLSRILESNPFDTSARSLLVVTMFLRGDMERALTEAIKLRSLNCDYGRFALKRIASFLGPEHELVLQLGVGNHT